MNLILEISNAWGWIGIDPIEVVVENDFGNLIVRDSEGKYWRLCPEEVYCEVVANTKKDFDALFRDKEFLSDWHMITLVNAARDSVGSLVEGCKYCLIVPGVLGGAYDASNIRIVSFAELVRFSGELGKQMRDLPDGAQVQLKFMD